LGSREMNLSGGADDSDLLESIFSKLLAKKISLSPRVEGGASGLVKIVFVEGGLL